MATKKKPAKKAAKKAAPKGRRGFVATKKGFKSSRKGGSGSAG